MQADINTKISARQSLVDELESLTRAQQTQGKQVTLAEHAVPPGPKATSTPGISTPADMELDREGDMEGEGDADGQHDGSGTPAVQRSSPVEASDDDLFGDEDTGDERSRGEGTDAGSARGQDDQYEAELEADMDGDADADGEGEYEEEGGDEDLGGEQAIDDEMAAMLQAELEDNDDSSATQQQASHTGMDGYTQTVEDAGGSALAALNDLSMSGALDTQGENGAADMSMGMDLDMEMLGCNDGEGGEGAYGGNGFGVEGGVGMRRLASGIEGGGDSSSDEDSDD